METVRRELESSRVEEARLVENWEEENKVRSPFAFFGMSEIRTSYFSPFLKYFIDFDWLSHFI